MARGGPSDDGGSGVKGQATRGTLDDAVDRSRIYKLVGQVQRQVSIETSEAARETSRPQGARQAPWSPDTTGRREQVREELRRPR